VTVKSPPKRKLVSAFDSALIGAGVWDANHWRPLGAASSISGVGFFDIPHAQKPHATNFAEVRPVMDIKFVSG
jgi:hypothetical protein